jgi:hypothetical protein
MPSCTHNDTLDQTCTVTVQKYRKCSRCNKKSGQTSYTCGDHRIYCRDCARYIKNCSHPHKVVDHITCC